MSKIEYITHPHQIDLVGEINSGQMYMNSLLGKEEELIDEAANELKENRIGTIRTAHDGLVQQSDVFTQSLGRTPGGRGRDRGVSRDTF